MQQIIAPRLNFNSIQDHVTDEQLLRDQMDQSTSSTSAYSSAEAMQTDNMSPPEHDHSDHLGHDLEGSGDGSGDGRKGYGKRELSTSKRAAQNRAAQRAFRQRKEGYIKKLEEQVRDYQILSEQFKSVQTENYQLRDYIISLQSRLLESQGEVPPPPPTLDGLQPGKVQQLPPSTTQPPLQQQQQQQATLPRISELGSIQPPHLSGMSKPEMTPAQAALQSPSILRSPPSVSRLPQDNERKDIRYPGI